MNNHNISYDRQANALYVELVEEAEYDHAEVVPEGMPTGDPNGVMVILSMDKERQILGVEILLPGPQLIESPSPPEELDE